ncbi:hypothetical protein ACPPVO_44920 [Dactylosporangium sp. McL0621]|uniref:hypothetical protein n=1 Tax=Dactylosporangium sp. McL0621 TaxID=3415678 RepID=UPI003CF46C10
MKLLYCAHCGDIVRLFPDKRYCRCGKSWGHYLADNSTTVQTWPGLSLGIANPDFVQAQRAFGEDVEHFSPLLSMRCWVNPVSEPDVTFVMGTALDEPETASKTASEPETASEPVPD